MNVDNTEVRSSGLSHIGYQELNIQILEGAYQGQVVPATNSLVGSIGLVLVAPITAIVGGIFIAGLIKKDASSWRDYRI